MKVVYSRRAIRDLEQIYSYYRAVADPRIAEAVAQSINAAISRITLQPQNAPRITARPGARAVWVPRYFYRIFYRVRDAAAVEILHIRHTSRRPWGEA